MNLSLLQVPAATQSSASESDEGEDGSKVINGGGKKSGKERKTSTEIAEEVAKGMTTHAISFC